MADHKYIRREGTRGNYKYIYEDDLKDLGNYKPISGTSLSGERKPANPDAVLDRQDRASVQIKNTRNYYNAHTNTKAGHKVTSGEVQGPPEVSKEYLEAYRANTKKNDYTPHIVPANNTPKPASNQNHTFTLGPNGTTVPVSNAPQKKESKNPFAGVGKAVSGFGKGVASGLNSAGKGIASTANAAGKGISSAANKAGKGMTVAANGARKDIKNAGSKLVMGANGAVEKVKDSAEDAGKDIKSAANKASKGISSAANKVTSALSKFFGGEITTEHHVSAGGSPEKKSKPAPKAEVKKKAAETRKVSAKSIENDKATISGSQYLKKAASKGLSKGDDLYDQFEEAKDIEIVGDKNKIEKFDKYLDRSITVGSLQKKAVAKRKAADDAVSKMQDHSDEFNKRSAELESNGAPMTKLDVRHYLRDKRFKDMIRLDSDGEEVTDEQMYEEAEKDPYISIPTEMVKDLDKLLEEAYGAAEKEHAARRAEYMANIMEAQAEKHYDKELKGVSEDDFEWYQNGKKITDDGEVSTSHKVKERY